VLHVPRRAGRVRVPGEEGVIEAPRLFTSHWRNPELRDLDATIISISRGEPRWRLPFAYRRLRPLAPNAEAWRKQDRERFEAAYLGQLEELGAERILADLERIGGPHPTIMLCWERPHEEFCHRWLLARYIEREAGIVVLELQPGMLPRRATSQPPLFDERGGA
jgi:hypothetical protein